MAAAATKWLHKLAGRSSQSSRNLELFRPATPCVPSSSSSHQFDHHHPPLHRFSAALDPPSSRHIFDVGAPLAFPHRHAFLSGTLLLVGTQAAGSVSRVGWDSSPGRSVAAFSRIAPTLSNLKPSGVGESSRIDPERPDQKKQSEDKSWGSRLKDLFSSLEKVPAAPLGLGLGGAIPFVSLTPGIASLLPMPDALFAIHIEAQAAYGAVILTFLGGPYWGLAMAGSDSSQNSKFSNRTIQNVRYMWSVIPSLVAWPALLLNPVPKFAVLITSYLVVLISHPVMVLGVDAAFARSGLLPSWYLPMRYLFTGIATLSMASSLLVSAAGSIISH